MIENDLIWKIYEIHFEKSCTNPYTPILTIENTLTAKAALYKIPEVRNLVLLLRNNIAAYTTTKSISDPTIPPERIINTGRLIKRYIITQIIGMIQASRLTIFFRFSISKKLIQPICPNTSGNTLVHAASEANTLENKTKNAPIR